MKPKKELLSIVVPCHNEEESVPLFYDKTTSVLKTMDVDYQLLFVDDGSKDKTLEKLKELHSFDKRAEYYSLSRNFGKESAMYCGLCNAKGDYVVIMDADLQHSPDLLPTMLQKVKCEGYDSCAARRMDRKGESKIRSFLSNSFYNVLNKLSDTEIVAGSMDFRLMNRKMLNAVLSMSEYNRFTKGIFAWVGFRTSWLEVENVERVAGKSSWNTISLMKYALEGIFSFSNKPLSIASWLGSIVTIFAFVYLVFVIVKYCLYGEAVQGWPTMICIMLFLGGVQLLFMGIIGQYLGKTYLEVKRRPVYLLSESSKDNEEVQK